MNAISHKPDLGAPGYAASASARTIVEAKHHGRIVARTVLDPLDGYSNSAQITDAQHECGMRVRTALAGALNEGHVTAGAMYASEPGEHDDLVVDLTEQEKWDLKTRHFNTRLAAERLAGDNWPVVQRVCAGEWASSCAGGLPALRVGLQRLVVGWGVK